MLLGVKKISRSSDYHRVDTGSSRTGKAIAPDMKPAATLSVIYLVGRGHSGSTLLETMLGSHPQLACLGELKWLSEKKKTKGKARQERCSCGAADVDSCPFWQAVNRRLMTRYGVGLDELDLRTTDEAIFAEHNLALLETVQALSGSNVLIDSSKSHERLSQLRVLGDRIELYPVYVVRNPCGVVYSHVRKGRGLKHWARKYRAKSKAIHASLEQGPLLVVDYAELTAAPLATLNRVADYVGLDEKYTTVSRPREGVHIIGGNAMKSSAELVVTPDVEWRSALTLRQKLIIHWYTLGHTLELRRLKKRAGR